MDQENQLSIDINTADEETLTELPGRRSASGQAHLQRHDLLPRSTI